MIMSFNVNSYLKLSLTTMEGKYPRIWISKVIKLSDQKPDGVEPFDIGNIASSNSNKKKITRNQFMKQVIESLRDVQFADYYMANKMEIISTIGLVINRKMYDNLFKQE